tara:strand:- start:6393 stop:7157 length:765 start_codon:yes stop_codon:yes gene_type:complete
MSESKNWRSIRSYGTILVKINNGIPEYLMVCRKSTYCYVDFILGKYNDKNIDYIKFMIKNMTHKERAAITSKSFEELWKELYSYSRNPSGAFYDYVYAKFERVYPVYLVFNGSISCKYKHPEWGFPKGRPNHSEDPFDCASRELFEETRISKNSYEIISSILPFEEKYVGTNGIGYRNVFFIGFAKDNCTAYLDKTNSAQSREIGYIKWFPYDHALRQFRNHEESKRTVLECIHTKLLDILNKNDDMKTPLSQY